MSGNNLLLVRNNEIGLFSHPCSCTTLLLPTYYPESGVTDSCELGEDGYLHTVTVEGSMIGNEHYYPMFQHVEPLDNVYNDSVYMMKWNDSIKLPVECWISFSDAIKHNRNLLYYVSNKFLLCRSRSSLSTTHHSRTSL